MDHVHGVESRAVEARDLTHAYGDRVGLQRVSFSLESGLTALLGPNGAGKTTLLRLLAGHIAVQQGGIEVCGASTRSARARTVAYLPQDPDLLGAMKVLETVEYTAWLADVSSRQARSVGREVLSKVGLEDRAGARVRELSGGMQRRLAIACTLVSDPAVVLLDEPMSGLDPAQRTEIRSVLRQVSERTSVIVSTHVMGDIPALTEHVLMLDQGALVFDGSVNDFLDGGAATTEGLERAFLQRMAEEG